MTKNFTNALVYYFGITTLFFTGLGLVSLLFSTLLWFGTQFVINRDFLGLWLSCTTIVVFSILIKGGIIIIPILGLITYPKIFKCKTCNKWDAITINREQLISGKLICSDCKSEQ